MGIVHHEWAPQLLIEANKFWLYSIVCSLSLSLLTLITLSSTIPERSEPVSGIQQERHDEKSDKKKSTTDRDMAEEANFQRAARQKVISRIAADACDVLIPGAMVGWIPVSASTVGVAGSVSSLLAMMEIWERVKGN